MRLTLNELRARLRNVKGESPQFTARCPAHDDRANSLSVGLSSDATQLLLHCHAGCTTESIVDALGIKMSDLFATEQVPPNQTAAQLTYLYHNADGALLYTKTRKDNPNGTKDFLFKRPNGEYGVKGIQRVPYNLPAVIAAQTVYIVEGEKCADAIIKAGRTATTLDGGANSKWLPEYGAYFTGKTVFIIPDNDEPGMKYAQRIADNLPGSRIVELPGLPAKADIYDWLRAGHTMDELDALPSAEPVSKTEQLKPLCSADVIVKPVKWLWQDVFVNGGVNSIQGIAGIGKTFLLCAASAAVSSGGFVQSVNGGMEQLERGRVLYISGDDDISTTIVPRLMSFNADLENIFFPPDGLLPPVGSENFNELFKLVKPSLCILDTLQHFLPKKVDLNSANATTSALQPLKKLAEKYNCAIVTIQHISKVSAGGGGGHSVNFGIGSAAVNGLFRSVWTLGRVKGDDGKPSEIRALAPSKTNLVVGDPPCILFELSQENGFLWAGIDDELTAERLYDPSRVSTREAPERDECVEFLKELLSAGPLPASEASEAAEANGYSTRTLERAKKKAGVYSFKEKGKNGLWHWDLKDRHLKICGGLGGLGNVTDKDRQDRQHRHVNTRGGLTENGIFRGTI